MPAVYATPVARRSACRLAELAHFWVRMLWPRMLASLAAAELAARHQGTSPPFTVSFRAFEGDMAEVTPVKRQWCFFFFAALWNDIFILLHYHRDHFLDHFSSFDLSGRSFILLSYHMRRSGDNGRTLRVAAGSSSRPASGAPTTLANFTLVLDLQSLQHLQTRFDVSDLLHVSF